MTIKLTLKAQTLTEGQTTSASSFVSSITDSAKRSITQYSVSDNGADGGYFMLNGVKQSSGAHTYTAAQFAQLVYVAGPNTGSETISIKVYDGSTWSSVVSAKETTTAPATTTTNVVTLLEQLGVSASSAQQMAAGTSLSYNNLLTILQDAAVGGMTTTKFNDLKTLASMFNKAGGFTVSSYVQQIADDLILGNSANAQWHGGSSSATTLGNLSATSTQTQVNELIGKWFLGTDLPSLDQTGIGGSNYGSTYQNVSLPLFGNTGVPSYLDVNQGNLGDCYFVAALGETALRDPTAIENMITDNGNGTYSVCFYVNGQPDYVTVNGQLPVLGSGYSWANGSTLEFANGPVDWVALVEKAFVELNEQTAAASYGGHTAGNAYEDINGGTAITLSEITDQTFVTYNLTSSESSSSLNSLMSTLNADWAAGDEIILSTPSADNGNLVGDHMYIVTGVNAANGTITIQNPWNSAYSGTLQMSFTDSIAQLAADNVSIYATTGTKVA